MFCASSGPKLAEYIVATSFLGEPLPALHPLHSRVHPLSFGADFSMLPAFEDQNCLCWPSKTLVMRKETRLRALRKCSWPLQS